MTVGRPDRRAVLYWIACAAPPALEWEEPVRELQADGWDVYAIPTEAAASWLDLDRVAEVTGHAVRVRPRMPRQSDELPAADAVLVAPASFNTLNQWAAGINNSLSLGLLNELLGLEVPIVAAMYCKAALTAHPAYGPNVASLRDAGAVVLEGESSITATEAGFSWGPVRDVVARLRPASNQ